MPARPDRHEWFQHCDRMVVQAPASDGTSTSGVKSINLGGTTAATRARQLSRLQAVVNRAPRRLPILIRRPARSQASRSPAPVRGTLRAPTVTLATGGRVARQPQQRTSAAAAGGGSTKQGAGILTLTTTNTYTGPTVITGGTLRLTSFGSIANSSGVTIDGGTHDASVTSRRLPFPIAPRAIRLPMPRRPKLTDLKSAIRPVPGAATVGLVGTPGPDEPIHFYAHFIDECQRLR